jgi:hypothetical protein
MTFAIIKAESDTKRDGVCVIDGKAINKGDKVVLLGNKVKGQKITDWQVAHIAPKCADKVEKWITEQPGHLGTSATPPPSPKGYGGLNNIDEAFKLVAAGNKRRDNELSALAELVGIQAKTIATLINRITGIESVVQFPESSQSNPARPAADSENKPVNCLGVRKTDGKACQQTQNRLEANGYCGQHQGQSGDSERAKLDKHAEEVTAAAEEDRPAVSQDTLELLS